MSSNNDGFVDRSHHHPTIYGDTSIERCRIALPMWWAFSIEGGNMHQINVCQFYHLGMVVHPLTEMQAGQPLKAYYFNLMLARGLLHFLLNDRIIPMAVCKDVSKRLFQHIDQLITKTDQRQSEQPPVDFDRKMTEADLFSIIETSKEFEAIFSAELQNLATYCVSKKGIYDTNDLIVRADELFTEHVRQYLSEKVKHDVREAGKCLAFDLATAAGFHIARAVEGVLLDYLQVLCPQVMAKLQDATRNLGHYICLARQHQGDDKACSALDQFRSLHRNPLIHPERVLTVDEAITLLGIAQSAIVAMVLDIERIKNQTEPESVS